MHILISGFVKIADSEGRFENRLRNYFLDFAQQVTIICDDTDALSVLRALNYTQVQFRSLLRRVPNGTLRRRIIYPGL